MVDLDRNLIALLQRCRERNFKLNKDKFVFKKQKLKYCGHILTSEGILPDPAKVEAITQMPRPRGKTEVRRPLGMINYLGKFFTSAVQRRRKTNSFGRKYTKMPLTS